jgi:hypothetical protein
VDRLSKKFQGLLKVMTVIVTLFITGGCEHDFYETGDSGLSYLHTDFVEARTNTATAFFSAHTDDGVRLTLQPALKTLWATKGDTTYRALLYYNKVENGVTEPVAISPVAVLRIRLALDLPPVHTDPVGFESAWISRDKKYLNLGLKLKTGKSDDTRAVQSLGIVCDSVRRRSSGSRIFYLRLYHRQNGIPEYYSTRVFASIPLQNMERKDSVVLDINTYKGKVRKQFAR